MNTTSNELSNVAVEISVWDLEGACPYYKVTQTLSVPPKKVLSIVEMKYPQYQNAKPVYFLLLKLFRKLDNGILSRNFYWLHQPGGDYKLLEPYRQKKIPLKVATEVMITGSTYTVQVHVKNNAKPADSRIIMENHFAENDEIENKTVSIMKGQVLPAKEEVSLLRKICSSFSGVGNSQKVLEVNGSDTGVALFLKFSVHAVNKKYQENPRDTRILPVHYTNNYFSLVPGESIKVGIVFDVPKGVTPRVSLHGWNYQAGHFVF